MRTPEDLGFSEKYLQEAAGYPDLFLGRVVSQHKEIYKVATAKSDVLAELSGKMRNGRSSMVDYPVVGDFVLVDRDDDAGGRAIICRILPRKSLFVRKAAGTSNETQPVSANVDTVFICMSLTRDFNLRRIERYLAIAWDSGAVPVIVLTKADLYGDPSTCLSEIYKVASGVDVAVTSSMEEDGYRTVLKYIAPGRTVAFMGSSGVGKSTLINRLLGQEVAAVNDIRSDDRGRHTTTGRQLYLIPTGGAVIDNPGMRELGVEHGDFSRAFADIEELAEQCRFRDCRHGNEPGCAVRKAIEEGLLYSERLENYFKLKKEAKYDSLNSKQIEKEKIGEMFSDFGGIKNAKKYIKTKNDNRWK